MGQLATIFACMHTLSTSPDHLSPDLSLRRGTKFAKLRKRFDAEHALEKYEPFIVQSANFP